MPIFIERVFSNTLANKDLCYIFILVNVSQENLSMCVWLSALTEVQRKREKFYRIGSNDCGGWDGEDGITEAWIAEAGKCKICRICKTVWLLGVSVADQV